MFGESEEAKNCTRQVLYTCLDTAMKLISPFMPYISEELWQRLPRRSGENPPSICVSQYPKVEKVISNFIRNFLNFWIRLILRNEKKVWERGGVE